jgi:hypothetical protein
MIEWMIYWDNMNWGRKQEYGNLMKPDREDKEGGGDNNEKEWCEITTLKKIGKTIKKGKNKKKAGTRVN